MGQIGPMIAAVIAIPILIQHLGAPRFGVTLAWAAIGYLHLFDLGLGRAFIQAIAMRLGELVVRPGERELLIAWARTRRPFPSDG
jgi:hypothetical protein